MGDVDIYYAELSTAAMDMQRASSQLMRETAQVAGEDTGIENPADRPDLRLEVHARLTALHDRAADSAEAASDLSASLTDIADSFREADGKYAGEVGK